jgi:hypothetical protein
MAKLPVPTTSPSVLFTSLDNVFVDLKSPLDLAFKVSPSLQHAMPGAIDFETKTFEPVDEPQDIVPNVFFDDCFPLTASLLVELEEAQNNRERFDLSEASQSAPAAVGQSICSRPPKPHSHDHFPLPTNPEGSVPCSAHVWLCLMLA